MPDDPDPHNLPPGIELVEAIIRAEFQAVLLCAAVAIRAGAGRDCAGLNGLIASGDRRIAEMEGEQLERLAGERQPDRTSASPCHRTASATAVIRSPWCPGPP